jgi:hypothetical protein
MNRYNDKLTDCNMREANDSIVLKVSDIEDDAPLLDLNIDRQSELQIL